MLAFSNDYYGMIFFSSQSVELFCAYPGFRFSLSNLPFLFYHSSLLKETKNLPEQMS